MNIKDVCRLCLVNNNLLWIFDQRFDSNNHMKDLIFKTLGIQISQEDIISQKICHKCAEDVVKLYKFRKESIQSDLYLKEQQKKMNLKRTPHRSILELYEKFPRLQLPNICITENISPMVEMEMDEVENYFKKEKRNFERYVQRVIRHSKIQERKSKIPTETVSPISIKFREDKSSYEIVHKITEEPYLQSDPVINRKRQLSDSEPSTSKRVRSESDSIQLKPIVLRRQSIGHIDLNSRHAPSLDMELTENGNDHPIMTKSVKGKAEIISNILIDPVETLRNFHPMKPNTQLNEESTSTNTNNSRLSNEDFHSVETPRNMDIPNYLGIVSINKSISEHLQTNRDDTLNPQSEINDVISNNSLIDNEFDCKYCNETFASKDICETHLLTCYNRKDVKIPAYVSVENIDHNENVKETSCTAFNYSNKTNISEVIEICSEDEEEIKPVVLDLQPQIQIKDSRFPIKNFNSSTNDILNKLLVFDKNESPSDKNSQTELTSENPDLNKIISDITHVPKKDSIVCQNNDLYMNNLKSYIHTYKVPVYINHGEKLEARFNLEESKKRSKTYKDWINLTPIDLIINEKTNGSITNMDNPEIRQILDSISTISNPVQNSSTPVINVPNATLSKILDTPNTNENVTAINSLSIDEKIKQLEINNINVSKDPTPFNEVNTNLPDLAECLEEIFASDTNNVEPVVNTVNSPIVSINNTNDVSINPQVGYLVESNNNQTNTVSINAQVGYILDPSRPVVITSTNQPNDVSSSIPQVGILNLPNIYLHQQNYFSNMLVQHKENSRVNYEVPYTNLNHQINAPIRPTNYSNGVINYGNNMNVYNQPNLNNSHIVTNRTWVPPHFNPIQLENNHPVNKGTRPHLPPYDAYNKTFPSFQKNLHHKTPNNRTINCTSEQNNIQTNRLVPEQYTQNCISDISNNLTVNNKTSTDNCHVTAIQNNTGQYIQNGVLNASNNPIVINNKKNANNCYVTVNQVIQNNRVISVQYIQNGVPDARNNPIAVNNKESTDNLYVAVNQDIPISDTINNASIRVRPLSDLK